VENLPIGDYALLSDCRSAALVSRGGSVDWLCAPRFDAASIFGRLLDGVAGHWSIHPDGKASVSRRYLPDTMVLETIFRTASGTLRLIDAMALGPGERGHGLGLASPGALVRQVTCLEGTVEVEMEFAPRPEYGIVHPLLAPMEGGLIARGGADVLVLSAPTDIMLDRSTARVRPHMEAARPWALRCVTAAAGSRCRARGNSIGSPRAWKTPSQAGARGRPSTSNTRDPGENRFTTVAACSKR
jgi:hypothetical protein